MPYLAEAAISAGRTWPATDFMRRAYELNGEPLRLLQAGQQWFGRILSNEYCAQPHSNALVLGATPWLTRALYETAERTRVVDTSVPMLAMCESWVRHAEAVEPKQPDATDDGSSPNEVAFVHGDWLALPPSGRNLDLVAGDNSFSFLRYPGEWDEMLDILSERMTERSVLFARLLSVPATHRRLCPAEIVKEARAGSTPVNFTAVRVALLFAHWDPIGYAIRPEEALVTFEEHRREFDPLISDVLNPAHNDLLSIEKYRDSGATYFAPPLAEAIARFERRLHVRAVHFGPYEMSQYFPLIVASKV